MNTSLTTLSLCLLGMAVAPAVLAQAAKSPVDVAATTGAPEFRDPKTGMVWTPETVGQGGKPILPEDHAFDPTSQSAPMQNVVQRATLGRSAACRSPPDQRYPSSTWRTPCCARSPRSAGRW